MKLALLLCPLLMACEPPAAVVFELVMPPEVLNSPIKATELTATFCPIATGCDAAGDFTVKRVSLGHSLRNKETIAFTPDQALAPNQKIFFEFVLSGTNDQNESEVIASATLTDNLPDSSYFKRQKAPLDMALALSPQPIQDGTIPIGSVVHLTGLRVNAVSTSNTTMFVEATESDAAPSYPRFSGLTVKGSVAQLAPLLVGDCRDISGLIGTGNDGEPELQADTISPAQCGSEVIVPETVFPSDFLVLDDARPFDGVLLSSPAGAIVDNCNVGPNLFCVDDGTSQLPIDDFAFEDGASTFQTSLQNSNNVIGAGEIFGGQFLILPRTIDDIF